MLYPKRKQVLPKGLFLDDALEEGKVCMCVSQ